MSTIGVWITKEYVTHDPGPSPVDHAYTLRGSQRRARENMANDEIEWLDLFGRGKPREIGEIRVTSSRR
jgi:hypothetical protein